MSGKKHAGAIGFAVCLAFVCAFACAGCGDDDYDDSTTEDGGLTNTMDGGGINRMDGGLDASGFDAGGDGGPGRLDSSGESPDEITPLEDGIVGSPCTTDADCGSGFCATELRGGAFTTREAPGGYCTGECTEDSHCGEGGVCVGGGFLGQTGLCYAACEEDGDCREGYQCVAGMTSTSTCRPAPETDQLEDGVVGQACTEDANCPDGTCLTGGSYPDGYCSGVCYEDSHCGENGFCLMSGFGSETGDCHLACMDDADCPREGYRCRNTVQGIRACLAAPDPLPDDVVGQECDGDEDCGGGQDTCQTELPASGFFGQALVAEGGYCSQACEEDSDCGSDGVCLGGFAGALCYRVCQNASDCRSSYVCEDRGSGGQPALVCVPEPPEDGSDAG